MTREQREQAAEVLEKFQKGIYGYGGKVGVAIDTAIAVLREPKPDPITGLVPCRWCGGKAGFHYSVMMRDNDCYVECGVCGEHSKVALSEEEARDAWNTAMGYTAPPRPGAIGPETGEMAPNGGGVGE